MIKKVKQKRRLDSSKPKTVGFYLRIYTISVTAGFAVFLMGTLFASPPRIPCANTETCDDSYIVKIDNTATGTYLGHAVVPPDINPATDPAPVLGTNDPAGEKHIYTDLSTQTLYAYEGGKQIMEMRVSTGKWNPTPTGNFKIWLRLRATRMSGGEGADYYNLPNVPYTMFYYGDYGLHGAYWHNNFGHKMSHGCTNLRIVDARDLYNWAETGTPVSVCDSFIGPSTCVQKNPVN